MDYSVRKVVLSVIVTSVIVLLSIPFWIYSSSKRNTIVADNSDNMDITVNVGQFASLVIIEDERAMDFITPTDVSLRNRNDHSKEFKLLLSINKESTVPSQFIRVSVDDKIIKLVNLESEEDDINYYFILEDEQLDAYSEITKKVRIWLSEDTKGLSNTSTLKTNFITR